MKKYKFITERDVFTKNRKMLKDIKSIVKSFPTKSDPILQDGSYFYVVLKYLMKSRSFLEIGYRKGLFVEICKYMNIPSCHIDITYDLLCASPTENNKCITISSEEFLENCNDKYDLIFQDGSKSRKIRRLEYDLIERNDILCDKGTILVDDLHYKGCRKSFQGAISKFNYNYDLVDVVSDEQNKYYKMGIIHKGY